MRWPTSNVLDRDDGNSDRGERSDESGVMRKEELRWSRDAVWYIARLRSCRWWNYSDAYSYHRMSIMHIQRSLSSYSDIFTHHMRSGSAMLRFRLKELMAEKEFREGRVVTMVEVANATGIHRMTLSKLSNHRGYNPTADVLDRLCAFFNCRIEQLVEYIPGKSHLADGDE